MTPEQHARIKAILIAACERPAAERDAFVEQACGADAELRQQVQALLEHASVAAADTVPIDHAPGKTPAAPAAPAAPRDYAPGDIVAARYRIETILGRGGMGAVYRAEDLRLKQTVAVKFLPPEFARNASARTRLVQEVRVARSITSPFLCRVHDIIDAPEGTFLSMEYIDGENLRSLLTRIGRVPQEKASEIACQLCFGLAVVHAAGVLHRDLKPANILIDGRGHTHITDFGLSAIREEIPATELRAGTPAYMAPEQMRGSEVSVRSDLYSLGLVLYELFVGQRAFSPGQYAELAARKEKSQLQPPSHFLPEIDSAVEQVILKCLAPEPADRPESALAVAAAFFKGDRLAAALAAGFVPTPDDVAAGGTTEPYQRWRGVLQVAGVLALLAVCFVLSPLTRSSDVLRRSKAPAVLAERAREITANDLNLGPAREEAWGFCEGRELIGPTVDAGVDAVAERYGSPTANSIVFWFRASAASLQPQDAKNRVFEGARITATDPPLAAGSTLIALDAGGALLGFARIPPLGEPAAGAPFDWSSLLARHGLQLRDAVPADISPAKQVGIPFDSARAWRTRSADGAPSQLTAHVAELGNRPVFLALLDSPAEPEKIGPWGDTQQRRWFVDRFVEFLTLALLFVAIPFVRLNLVRGQTDPRGARRLAGCVFVLCMLIWLLWTRHQDSFLEWTQSLLLALAGALVYAAAVWLFFMALEPFVRRTWPHTLISVTRVLQGRIRDVRVGQDVLVGVLLGALWAALMLGESALATRVLGASSDALRRPDSTAVLLGGRAALGFLATTIWVGLYNSVFLLLAMTALRRLLRTAWVSTIVAGVLLATLLVPRGSLPLTALVSVAGIIVSIQFGMRTHGILALAVGLSVCVALLSFPLTFDTRAWFADTGYFVGGLCLAVALTAYSFTRIGQRRSAA